MNFHPARTFLGFLLLSSGNTGIFASQPWADEVLDDRIKSVLLYVEGWNLSYPVIKINSEEKLVLDFDLIADDPETFYYSFIHCDRDWRESSVFPTDFINGPSEDQIEDYKRSFNTKTNYYHYRLVFPNDRMGLRISGNYIIKVYSAGNPDKPVMTKRFMISEESASLTANVHRPPSTVWYNTGQEVDFIVSFPGLRVNDPAKDISSVVLQNGKWFDARSDLRPDITGNNELKYSSLSDKNIFPGGNEYRYFDTKSLLYQTEFVRKIDFVDGIYHVFLVPSDNREFKPYFFDKDLNGKYYVAIKEGKNMETDADYVYVYFTLPSKYKIDGGEMYVSGALANWAFTAANRMTYDQEKGEYQCTMLLKQGWYNYEYIFLKKGETSAAPSYFEGNHYETENDYLIIVYYRSPMDRYDRIIGTTVAKSSKQETN
jgi:Domain of unknown function (DUF5103)